MMKMVRYANSGKEKIESELLESSESNVKRIGRTVGGLPTEAWADDWLRTRI